MNKRVSTFDNQPASTKLWFLSVAFADLEASEGAARSAFQLALNGELDSPLCDALIEVAVVRYSRPHRESFLPDRVGKIRLPERFIPPDPNVQHLHKHILATRDTSMAHSDMSVREARIVRMEDREGLRVWKGLTSRNTVDPISLNGLQELCFATRGLMLPTIRELADEVMPNAAVGQLFELHPDFVLLVGA